MLASSVDLKVEDNVCSEKSIRTCPNDLEGDVSEEFDANADEKFSEIETKVLSLPRGC